MAQIFIDGTVYSTTKLDMINTCLMSIGEVPLPEDTIVGQLQAGSDADVARRIVEETMVEVQARGWFFNTDYNFKLVPDENGFIALPANVLKVDFGETEFKHQYILKSNKVYDVYNHTYIIDKPLTADVIYLTDYENLPPEAFQYIQLRSARKFQQRVITSSEIAQLTSIDEADAYNNLIRLQAQVQDYSLIDKKVSTRTHNGWIVLGMHSTPVRR